MMFKHVLPLFFVVISIQLLPAQFGELAELQPVYRQQIIDLTDQPVILAAMNTILLLEEETQANHIMLTEIPAPPFMEDKRAQAFMQMIQEIGIDSVWIDEVGNVIGLRRGSTGNRTVALDAHLDTVFPEGTDVTVHISGDTLRAPGISDDTRGLAMVLTVLKAINQHEISTEDDILFIGTVGEEGLGDLRGMKHLFRDGGPHIDSWISIDGGRIGRVNNKGLGSHRYEVTFNGPGGHSWGAFGLSNPIHAISKAISLFVERAEPFTQRGIRTSYNVGIIGGGTSVNSIPFESSMQIDMRSESPARLDSIDAIMHGAIYDALHYQNSLARIGDTLTVDIEQIGHRPSGELSPELPLIQRAIAATAYFGKRPELTRGSTNSNIPISLGIPAVTIGRGGSGGNAHALDEWFYNDEGHKSIQLALIVLLSEAGLEGQ